MSIKLLDCTLRDGAYIVEGDFGSKTIHGIIKRLSDAKVDIIECGWLKNAEHVTGSTYFHVPADIEKYMEHKKKNTIYSVMIDWDRYDLSQLPENNGQSIDAIRVVFPRGHGKEAISLGKVIREKGYRVLFQAANTLSYSDAELLELVETVNEFKPDSLSIVDTFGAMYQEDMQRIAQLIDHNLAPEIGLGLHTHNNMQQAFALSMGFISLMSAKKRNIIVDASLSGMGRGAGNAPTELIVGYLNRFQGTTYDMDIIMDIIDVYMAQFQKNYEWGYSTPLFLAGTYGSHVNNIAYLTQKHKTRNKDIKQILEALPQQNRYSYDYDLLEKAYITYQQNEIDDTNVYDHLRARLRDQAVLLIAPGASLIREKETIAKVLEDRKPLIIGINSVVPGYRYDYLFFSNHVRLEYAMESHSNAFKGATVILTSNLQRSADEIPIQELNIYYVNYNDLIKRGWVHFDNSTIMCLRLLDRLGVKTIDVAGFDGFDSLETNYISEELEMVVEQANAMNADISGMLGELLGNSSVQLHFITPSIFARKLRKVFSNVGK